MGIPALQNYSGDVYNFFALLQGEEIHKHRNDLLNHRMYYPKLMVGLIDAHDFIWFNNCTIIFIQPLISSNLFL